MRRSNNEKKFQSKRNNGYYYHKQANRTNPSNPIHVHVQYFKMICKRFPNAIHFTLAHLAPVFHIIYPSIFAVTAKLRTKLHNHNVAAAQRNEQKDQKFTKMYSTATTTENKMTLKE